MAGQRKISVQLRAGQEAGTRAGRKLLEIILYAAADRLER